MQLLPNDRLKYVGIDPPFASFWPEIKWGNQVGKLIYINGEHYVFDHYQGAKEGPNILLKSRLP